MIRFNNDYNHAAHESIYAAMKADQANNFPGYGADEWCTKAAEEIKKLKSEAQAVLGKTSE